MEGWSDSSMRKVSLTSKHGNANQHIFFLKLQIFLTLLWHLLYYLNCGAEHTRLKTPLFPLCSCVTWLRLDFMLKSMFLRTTEVLTVLEKCYPFIS